MCLLIVEILMLIAGLWAMISGQFPETLFKLLFGKGEYELDSRNVRLLGLLWASPIPLTFVGGFIIAILFEDEAARITYASMLDGGILFYVSLISVFIARKIKKTPKVSVRK